MRWYMTSFDVKAFIAYDTDRVKKILSQVCILKSSGYLEPQKCCDWISSMKSLCPKPIDSGNSAAFKATSFIL